MQAWSLWKDGNADKFIDSSIAESCTLDEASQCVHVGLLCVQDNPNARPLMSSVGSGEWICVASTSKTACIFCRTERSRGCCELCRDYYGVGGTVEVC
jgi:hypothetical protein